ncbi:MAG TPA: LemA family protein [Dehalococcoidia bacterium]|nr:LemA family protein [Dehalococcoidia bacterium]
MPLLSVVLGSLAALGCLAGLFWALRRKRLIDDLPTSKTQGVFIGLAELKGTAESETPLTSYLAGVPCVQYAWQVDEHWSRTVTETYTDSKGHTQTRTRTESGWTKVAGDSQCIPFYLKDDAGIIRIVPDGAKIHSIQTFDDTASRSSSLYFEKGPQHEIANSTHKRRFHETALPLHTMLYVVGQARERQDVVAAEIAYDKNAPMFFISTRTEKQVSAGYGRWFWLFLVLGLICAIGGAVARDMLADTDKGLSWQPFVIASVGFLAVLAVGWVWTVYNSLINLRNRLKQGWSQVDVQLKRRYDLIPNLVKTVEGYRDYESETQRVVTELRGQAEATPPGVSGPDFKGMAPMLRAVIERYPDLKASESFLRLQQALVDTEQRIALARDYFNDIATFYNTRLEIVPDRFVADLARLHPATLMSAADFERAPVQVKLAS